MNPLEALLERVLTEHTAAGWVDDGWLCGCGHVVELPPEHPAHVAQAIAAALGATVETEYEFGPVDGGPPSPQAVGLKTRTEAPYQRTRVRIPDLLGEWTPAEDAQEDADRAYWDNHTSDGRCKYPKTCQTEGKHGGAEEVAGRG